MGIDKKDFQNIYDEAHRAGMKAGQAHTPTPMIVAEQKNLFDNNNPGESWKVDSGICGFVWINIKPGNCAFANFLKKELYASPDSYYGGVCIWVSYFDQSMECKEKYAEAFAAVLKNKGIRTYAMSRMD